jgi:hypothetical protein
MDLPKLSSFDRSSLKREARWFFRKIRLSPILREPFKISTPSNTVIDYYALTGQMCSKPHTARTAPLILLDTRISKCAIKKFCINGQLRNKLFLIVIHRFSFVKVRWIFHAFVNCVMVLTNRLNFFIFQLSKAGQRPLHTCQLQKGGVFEV